MRYRRTPEFIEEYEALPAKIKAKVKKAFKLFKENPRHSSLQTKKIQGVEDIYEGRIDRKYRFTFHYDGDTVVFRRIGPHDVVDQEANQD
jgi:mRNA interferase RelE/StbE